MKPNELRTIFIKSRRVGMTKLMNDAVENAVRKMPKMRDLPNPLFSDFIQLGTLWVPNLRMGDGLFNPTPIQMHWVFHKVNKPKPTPKPEVDFEVNMMEALVGWKSWYIDSSSLKSNSGNCIWHPDKALEAECVQGCTKIPAEYHSCGIYAAESRVTAEEYGDVLGLVYGWGRYIRHDSGWKAQYAYPKCFYLREEQISLVDVLKQYHVPIYVSQPIKMYSPEEDGYGTGTEEENGDCGTLEEPFAGEAGSSGEDDED